MPPPGDATPPPSIRWWVCGLLLLATTLNYLDRVALNQTSIAIRLAFDLNDVQWGTIESAFSVAFAVGTITAGWVVDRVGVYYVYPILVVGWSLAGFLTGYADGFLSLLAFRFALGLFEAGNWPCGIRTTRQVLPPAERPFGNSLFQSGTAIGAIITPFIVIACYRAVGETDPDRWRWPFRVIGLIGLAWVAAWFAVARRSLVDAPRPDGPAATPFRAVFRDRRFWLTVAVVLAVNTSWHTFRVWMPLFLQKRRGYTEIEFQYFSIAYYVAADIGTWAVGLAVLGMTKRGRPLHQARMIGFAASVGLVLSSLAIPFVGDPYLVAAVFLTFAFGALGLFTAYFSLSQELSAAHQGKVTGTLGFINAIYLAGLFYAEGVIANALGRYDPILACAGIPALLAFVLVYFFWNQPAESSP
jgi:ACS family hexuronate transporter-like MFS transporter